MRIMINGQWRQQPDELNLAQLLDALKLEPRRVAVERNRELVPRAEFGLTRLADDDQLEIVTLVGGG